jgi:GNAT superfamily N-acetyltransferase
MCESGWFSNAVSVATLLRKASPGDAGAIGEISVLAWQGAYRGIMPDEYLDALDARDRSDRWIGTLREPPPRSQVLVADVDHRVVGFAALGPCADDGSVGELYAINLRPDCWGDGIGTVLLQAATEGLRRAGFEEAVLWVLPANDRARRFYEDRGWHAEDVERDEEVHDIVVREVRYRRHL